MRIVSNKIPHTILLYLIILQIYLVFAAPTVTPIDSGELITAGVCLGNAHSPGYSLHAILAKSFSFLPFGHAAFRTNILSGVAAAISILILSVVLNHLFQSSLIFLCAGFLFGLSRTYWAQSEITEVYSIFFMLFSAIIACMVKLIRNRQQGKTWSGWVFAGSFLGGLTLGIHQMLIFMVPGFILWGLYELKCELFRLKLMCSVFMFFLLGYSVLLYLPVRSTQNPVYAWENPETWENFEHLVTTATFHGQRFVRSYNQFREHMSNYIQAYFQQWPLILLLFPCFGWSYVKLKNCGFFFFTLICLAINFVSATMLFNLSERWFFTLDIFYLPGFFMLSIWGGVMFGHILEVIKKRNRMIVVIMFGLFALLPFFKNGPECYFRDRTIMRDWGVHLLSTLPSDAVLITQQDEIFGLWYLKYCEGWDETVELLHYESLHAPDSWFWRTVKNPQIQNCIKMHYTIRNHIPSDIQILEILHDSCEIPIYTTRHSVDTGHGSSWMPRYLAWKLITLNQQNIWEYRYTVFPVRVIKDERMDQVERYYLNAYVETYKTFARLEEEEGNHDKSLELWRILRDIDQKNRRSAVRNIRRLSKKEG